MKSDRFETSSFFLSITGPTGSFRPPKGGAQFYDKNRKNTKEEPAAGLRGGDPNRRRITEETSGQYAATLAEREGETPKFVDAETNKKLTTICREDGKPTEEETINKDEEKRTNKRREPLENEKNERDPRGVESEGFDYDENAMDTEEGTASASRGGDSKGTEDEATGQAIEKRNDSVEDYSDKDNNIQLTLRTNQRNREGKALKRRRMPNENGTGQPRAGVSSCSQSQSCINFDDLSTDELLEKGDFANRLIFKLDEIAKKKLKFLSFGEGDVDLVGLKYNSYDSMDGKHKFLMDRNANAVLQQKSEGSDPQTDPMEAAKLQDNHNENLSMYREIVDDFVHSETEVTKKGPDGGPQKMSPLEILVGLLVRKPENKATRALIRKFGNYWLLFVKYIITEGIEDGWELRKKAAEVSHPVAGPTDVDDGSSGPDSDDGAALGTPAKMMIEGEQESFGTIITNSGTTARSPAASPAVNPTPIPTTSPPPSPAPAAVNLPAPPSVLAIFDRVQRRTNDKVRFYNEALDRLRPQLTGADANKTYTYDEWIEHTVNVVLRRLKIDNEAEARAYMARCSYWFQDDFGTAYEPDRLAGTPSPGTFVWPELVIEHLRTGPMRDEADKLLFVYRIEMRLLLVDAHREMLLAARQAGDTGEKAQWSAFLNTDGSTALHAGFRQYAALSVYAYAGFEVYEARTDPISRRQVPREPPGPDLPPEQMKPWQQEVSEYMAKLRADFAAGAGTDAPSVDGLPAKLGHGPFARLIALMRVVLDRKEQMQDKSRWADFRKKELAAQVQVALADIDPASSSCTVQREAERLVSVYEFFWRDVAVEVRPDNVLEDHLRMHSWLWQFYRGNALRLLGAIEENASEVRVISKAGMWWQAQYTSLNALASEISRTGGNELSGLRGGLTIMRRVEILYEIEKSDPRLAAFESSCDISAWDKGQDRTLLESLSGTSEAVKPNTERSVLLDEGPRRRPDENIIAVDSDENPFDWEWRLDTFADPLRKGVSTPRLGLLEGSMVALVTDKAAFEGEQDLRSIGVRWIPNPSQLTDAVLGRVGAKHSVYGQHRFALDFSTSPKYDADEEGAAHRKAFLTRYHRMLWGFAREGFRTKLMTLYEVHMEIGFPVEDAVEDPDGRLTRVRGTRLDALRSVLTLNPFSPRAWRVYREYKCAEEAYLSHKDLFESEGLVSIFDADFRRAKPLSFNVVRTDTTVSDESVGTKTDRIVNAEEIDTVDASGAVGIQRSYDSSAVFHILHHLDKFHKEAESGSTKAADIRKLFFRLIFRGGCYGKLKESEEQIDTKKRARSEPTS